MKPAHVTHRMHAVGSGEAGSKARGMTGTPRISRPTGVAFARIRCAPAMGRHALPMTRRTLAMHCVGILRVHGRLARPIGVAHELPKVQSIVVRNFTPALPCLMLPDDSVKALPTGIRQQVRFLQATPAESRRGSLTL